MVSVKEKRFDEELLWRVPATFDYAEVDTRASSRRARGRRSPAEYRIW